MEFHMAMRMSKLQLNATLWMILTNVFKHKKPDSATGKELPHESTYIKFKNSQIILWLLRSQKKELKFWEESSDLKQARTGRVGYYFLIWILVN